MIIDGYLGTLLSQFFQAFFVTMIGWFLGTLVRDRLVRQGGDDCSDDTDGADDADGGYDGCLTSTTLSKCFSWNDDNDDKQQAQ